MAIPSNIIVGHEYAIVTENTTSSVTPSSNVIMGTVVSAEYMNGYTTVGDSIMYVSKDAYQFQVGGISYRVVPLTSILLREEAVS